MGEVATVVSQISGMTETIMDDAIFGTVIKIAFAGIILSIVMGLFLRKS